MAVPLETWWLPRPSKSKYPGSFPLHFEAKLFKLYPSQNILQPFGGKAEQGTRCDLVADTNPDYLCDAHKLPFADNTFDFVLCDPPYNNEYSRDMYGTGKIKKSLFSKEAVRVCKLGGYVALYDIVLNPRLEGTNYDRIIVVLTRVYHKPRICCIYKKESSVFQPKPDESRLLTAKEIVARVKEHNGDLVKMWKTEVKDGTLSVDSCMNYVLQAQRDLTVSIVRAKTLKEVGEWIANDNKSYWVGFTHDYPIYRLQVVLEALKKGELPT